MSILFIGKPADPVRRDALAREVSLLRAAGHDVRVESAPAPQGSAIPWAHTEVVVLEPGALAPEALIPSDGPRRILLRCPDGRRAAEFEREALALEAALRRSVILVPEHKLARKALARCCAGHRLSREDLGPMLDPTAFMNWRAPPAGRALRLTALNVITPGTMRGSVEPSGGGLLLLADPPDPCGAMLRRAIHAIEDGAILLASPAWRPLLGPAALYGAPTELLDEAERLARAPKLRRARRLEQFDAALPRFSEDCWLGRFEALLPSARDRSRQPMRHRVDRVFVAEFAERGEPILALARRLRVCAARGERVALLHLPGRRHPDALVNPLVDACVREGLAVVVHPELDLVDAAVVELHGGRDLVASLERLRPRIETGRLSLIAGGETAHHDRQEGLENRLGRLYQAPITPADNLGRHAVGEERKRARPVPGDRKPIIGLVAFTDSVALAALTSLEANGVLEVAGVRLLLAGPVHDGALLVDTWRASVDAGNIQILDVEGVAPERFLSGIDALVVPLPDEPAIASPTLVRMAVGDGLTVLAVPGADDGRIVEPLPIADWPARLRPPAELPPRPTSSSSRAAPPRDRRVLMVTANGVGLGHVARMAAISRRLPVGLAPVFATMSQAISVLHDMGYHAELVTGYGGQNYGIWNHWLGRRLVELIELHRPAAIVLDASNPYPGFLQAILPHEHLPLVWVRRGMWRPEQDNAEFLRRAPCFDLVIEPEDIADGKDLGATAAARSSVLRVPPIGLLDETDLLPRAAARAALALDPERPAVLLQLGSGTTRDLVALLDEVHRQLARFPSLQVVDARWLIADDSLDYWPGVVRLEGFPIARYFRAFDFTISAAGYNSFNDILRFGLPAVFIANDAAMMDDQAGRAAFAQDAEAAFDLRAEDLSELGDCVATLMDPSVRALMAANARRLARPNGAANAARAIVAVLNGQRLSA